MHPIEEEFIRWWALVGERFAQYHTQYPDLITLRDVCKLAYLQGLTDAYNRDVAILDGTVPHQSLPGFT